MTVTKSGVYQMSLTDYVTDPCPSPSLNAGTAQRLLTQSPRHAWTQHPRLNPDYQTDESARLDLGTIAHALLLERDASRVVVVQADDWRTKAAKEQREEARALGKLPILHKDYDLVNGLVLSAECTLAESEVADDWATAIPEQTLCFEQDGVWFRSRPDKATPDWRVLFDYKTCAGSASPAAWARGPLITHGYDLQAAIGLRGVKALELAERTTFVFVCQELAPPFALSLVSLSPQYLTIADNRLELAAAICGDHLESKDWPGYSSRIAYVDPPSYYGMEQHDFPQEAS